MSEFDSISTRREENNIEKGIDFEYKPDTFKEKPVIHNDWNETKMKRETPKVAVLIGLFILIFGWFLVVMILRNVNAISPDVAMIISAPPVLLAGVAYFVSKPRLG